ncbi:hypothetical protein H5410_055462 [Solanum commersonii]|uniref:Uncharacterized protein n=1 Tax=Solanum commersonii TaxID=4109 RepID=A0A9J5WJY5_SOLCO|nr:hypothetical protein H5410_055462 [Solanum commersonii]
MEIWRATDELNLAALGEIFRPRKQEEFQSGALLPMSKSASPELRVGKVSFSSQKNREVYFLVAELC